MTEAEYLASEDPKAMLDYLESQGLDSDSNVAAWVLACRHQNNPKRGYGFNLKEKWQLKQASEVWTRESKSRTNLSLPLDYRCALAREIWGNPFRPVVRRHAPKTQDATYKQWLESFNSSLLFEEDWLTSDVLTLAQIIRQGDHTAYEPLWDALHQAGCDNEEIRQHCYGYERGVIICKRKTCHGGQIWTNGHSTRLCQDCHGVGKIVDGWIPLRCQHVAGCWCIQLILGNA